MNRLSSFRSIRFCLCHQSTEKVPWWFCHGISSIEQTCSDSQHRVNCLRDCIDHWLALWLRCLAKNEWLIRRMKTDRSALSCYFRVKKKNSLARNSCTMNRLISSLLFLLLLLLLLFLISFLLYHLTLVWSLLVENAQTKRTVHFYSCVYIYVFYSTGTKNVSGISSLFFHTFRRSSTWDGRFSSEFQLSASPWLLLGIRWS